MYKNLLLIWLSIVILALSLSGQVKQDNVSIVGKAVDSNGCPVPNAEITYSPDPDADMLRSTRSGKDGRFELRTEAVSDSGVIWVTSGIDWENWKVLITPGVNLSSKYLAANRTIKLNQTLPPKIIDLKEVPIQAYYSPIKILVDDEWKERVFYSGDAIRFRVTDGDGEVAADSKGGRGVYEKESTIIIALPNGKWKLEIKTAKMEWQTIAEELQLSNQKEIVIRFPTN